MYKKTKQHYVPRFYLKNFANGKIFNLYNLKRNEVIYDVPYADQCYKKNFYGKDNIYEDKLSLMESVWALTIKKIIENPQIISDNDIEKQIKKFCCFQYFRTEAALRMRNANLVNVVKQIIPNIMHLKNVEIDNDETQRIAFNYVKSMESEEETVKRLIDTAEDLLEKLNDLKIVILKNNTSKKFIVSDNPVVIGNEFQPEYGNGLDCIGIYFLFPISSKQYIAIFDKKMYFKIKNKDIYSLSEENVNTLNIMQYQNALENIYSFSKQGVEYIKKYINNRSILIKNEFIHKFKYQENNFLSNEHKSKINFMFDDFVSILSPLVWTKLSRTNYQKLKLNFLEIIKEAKPFVGKINYNYSRSKSIEERKRRIALMNIAVNPPEALKRKMKKVNNRAQIKEINNYEEFLNKYFNNL
jgi:hypothetical protein